MVKNPPVNTGDPRDADLIPGSGRFPGGGNGKNPQHSTSTIMILKVSNYSSHPLPHGA